MSSTFLKFLTKNRETHCCRIEAVKQMHPKMAEMFNENWVSLHDCIKGGVTLKSDTHYFYFMLMKEGKNDRIERHLTLGVAQSLGITLRGKQRNTVIQIEFVCVTSSFFGELLGGGMWETRERGGSYPKRQSLFFTSQGINEGCQAD